MKHFILAAALFFTGTKTFAQVASDLPVPRPISTSLDKPAVKTNFTDSLPSSKKNEYAPGAANNKKQAEVLPSSLPVATIPPKPFVTAPRK